MALIAGQEGVPRLLDLAANDASPRVRAQAVRALADLADPNLTTPQPDGTVAESLVALGGQGQDPRVVLETVIALGRLRLSGLPDWIGENLKDTDTAIAHAAMQALRRSKNWPAILKLLDRPDSDPVRTLALRALADEAESVLANGLMARLQSDDNATRRKEYADALTRIHRKPGPWEYWTYRPPPRPANTISWESTAPIGQALDRALKDTDFEVRAFALERMQREQVPVRIESLAQWLDEDSGETRVKLILESMRESTVSESRPVLEKLIFDRGHAIPNRLTAFEIFAAGFAPEERPDLREFTRPLEDDAVLARILREWSRTSNSEDETLLFEKLKSESPEVRAAAIATLGEHGFMPAKDSLLQLLDDPELIVRRAAAAAAGKLSAVSTADRLLSLAAGSSDSALQREVLDSLRSLRDFRAVPIALRALENRETQLAAVNFLADLQASDHAREIADAAARNPSTAVLDVVAQALARWEQSREIADANPAAFSRELARFQGLCGHIVRWKIEGPLDADSARAAVDEIAGPDAPPPGEAGLPPWRSVVATGADSVVNTPAPEKSLAGAIWICATDVTVERETPVQFLASANGPIRVWLNGKIIRQSQSTGGYRPNADRFQATLAEGANRIVTWIESEQELRFHARFRRRSSTAAQEQLVQAAMTGRGNANRGRQLFFDAAKSQCILCHRLGEEGGRIGPDLSGLGGRFSRIYIVESILTPSSNITPGFQTLSMNLRDGRAMFGVKVSETETAVTLGDVQGQSHVIQKSNIMEVVEPPVSLMPPASRIFLRKENSSILWRSCFRRSKGNTHGKIKNPPNLFARFRVAHDRRVIRPDHDLLRDRAIEVRAPVSHDPVGAILQIALGCIFPGDDRVIFHTGTDWHFEGRLQARAMGFQRVHTCGTMRRNVATQLGHSIHGGERFDGEQIDGKTNEFRG